MPLDFSHIDDPYGYLQDTTTFLKLVEDYPNARAQHFSKLWLYFTDQVVSGSVTVKVSDNKPKTQHGRSYITGQELGLPMRITGIKYGAFFEMGLSGASLSDIELDFERKEPVTDNQIGWRVNTVVDYMYGKKGDRPRCTLVSTSEDESTAEQVNELLEKVLDTQAEPDWLTEFGQQAAIFGWVDVCVCISEDLTIERAMNVVGEDDDGNEIKEPGEVTAVRYKGEEIAQGDFDTFAKAVQWFIAPVDNVIPLVNPKIPTELWGWVYAYETQLMPGEVIKDEKSRAEKVVDWIELHTPTYQQLYRKAPGDDDFVLVNEMKTPAGELPVVHMQHTPRRRYYEGMGEVSGLIPYQDELNKRLSDRSHKITFVAFPPMLAKGIDNFEDKPWGPSSMWSSDNPDASIDVPNSDSKDQGEDGHITEIRDMMDRVSSVPPVAAGDIKDSIGNLTSAVAIKVVLRGLTDKLNRLRETHGSALSRIGELTVNLANELGILIAEDEQDRGVRAEWSETVETDVSEMVEIAIRKKALGVSKEQTLRELGYDDEEIERIEQENDEAAAKTAAAFGDVSPQFGDNEDDE